MNCGNPFLSAQEQAALSCTPAMIAGDQTLAANQVDLVIGRSATSEARRSRRSTYDPHANYRIVLGMKGDFADGWHYDAYGSYYYTSLFNANLNYLSFKNLQSALLVGGTAANPACLSGSPCVPWNIFNQGGVTPAAVSYLSEPGTAFGAIEEQIFEADLTGDLGKYGVKSPWANDGVGVSVGVSHRWDHLGCSSLTRPSFSGDLAGLRRRPRWRSTTPSASRKSISSRHGSRSSRSGLLFEDLALEVSGFRYSDYSTSGGVATYRVAGEWSPTADIRFRASYDRAIRAASILEAFTPQAVTTTSMVSEDFCAPDPKTGVAVATLAQCMHTGVTAAEYGNGGTTDHILQCVAQQCAALTGGNPTLAPEVADTYSVGATLTPTFLRGFNASIDYFNIKINGQIGAIALTTSFNNCLQTGDPTFCANVVRTPQGFLFGTTIAGGGYIKGISANVAVAQTSGVDFQANYHLPLEDVGAPGMGSVSVRAGRPRDADRPDPAVEGSADLRLRRPVRADLCNGEPGLAAHHPRHLEHTLERAGLAAMALSPAGRPSTPIRRSPVSAAPAWSTLAASTPQTTA